MIQSWTLKMLIDIMSNSAQHLPALKVGATQPVPSLSPGSARPAPSLLCKPSMLQDTLLAVRISMLFLSQIPRLQAQTLTPSQHSPNSTWFLLVARRLTQS